MLKEFKKFAMRGNVLDMAVGIVIGGAFTPIVKSMVDDVLMPVIGLLLGRVDFGNLFFVLRQGADAPGPYATLEQAQQAGAVTVNYGLFINTIVTFLIVAFAVFLLVRSVNRWQTAEEPPPPPSRECPFCKTAIAPEATRCPACTSDLSAT
jgi:large conductance mechanosensitive channel